MKKQIMTGILLGIAMAIAFQLKPVNGLCSEALQEPGQFLEREVHHQLVLLPNYSIFDWFEFRVDGYTVTLMGEVVQPVLKSDAENVVKHIEGVQKVVNNVKVLPLSNDDNHIRVAEYQAIYGDASLKRYALKAVGPIHIIFDNGHVTLKCVVANTMDNKLAGIRANGVPGVFSVDNQLQIEGSGK
jgi:hyperosmotically inducible periplasmic protein